MPNHNRMPIILPLAAAAGLGLAACTGASESHSEAPSTTRYPMSSDILPNDTADCTGKLNGFELHKDPRASEGQATYKVTSVSEGSCVSIYGLTIMDDIGSLAVGSKFFAGCTFGNEQPRLLLYAPHAAGSVLGDVNLTPAGLGQVAAEDMPSCHPLGVEDRGFIPN